MSSEHHTPLDSAERTRNGQTPLFTDAETVFHDMQDIVGRKWHPILVYYLLTDEPLGFSALKGRVDGISSKMLSESLSALEESGLVSRELLDDQPVRVEYTLTDRGRALDGIITEMMAWGTEHGEGA
jgi:DNA-binding HxlR family transcriptional regulator